MSGYRIIVDTREQTPFVFKDFDVEPGTLPTGDYSIKGLEGLVSIERKSLPDLIACFGPGRERFERELHRLKAYRCRAVIIECDYSDIVSGNYRSKMSPKAAVASIGAFSQRYQVPFILAGEYGAEYAIALMNGFHKDLVKLTKALKI